MRTWGDAARDRLPDGVFVAIIVLVQAAWVAGLVYLGFRFGVF